MKKLFLLILLVTLASLSYAQDTIAAKSDTLKSRSYPIIVADQSLKSFTMEQFNQNSLSGYRYLSHLSQKTFGKNNTRLLQMITSLIAIPLTHEEGHRSILTSQGIGSISQPIINNKGAAYVNGVTNATLMDLRQNNLPTYIRIHTAGLESDYSLLDKEDNLILFGQENKDVLLVDYCMRKLALIWYYSTSPFPKLSPKLSEEANELDRDIVGHDIYGAIKNLHRPNEPFYRYTNYSDLTKEEKRFANRVALRALFNIVSPVLIKPLNILDKENLKLSIGMGYSMAPFGDFIDQNIWIQYKQKYNIKAYLRQYENKNTWFPAAGLSLVDYQLSPKLSATIAGHCWSQPKELDFNTSTGEFGGSANILLKYICQKTKKGDSMSFDLGLNYKTKGFLPEEMNLKKNFGVRVGVTFNFLSK